MVANKPFNQVYSYLYFDFFGGWLLGFVDMLSSSSYGSVKVQKLLHHFCLVDKGDYTTQLCEDYKKYH